MNVSNRVLPVFWFWMAAFVSIPGTAGLFGGCTARLQGSADLSVHIEEGEYEGAAHFIVYTPLAIYYYDRAGGGFSRMIDRNGNDWIAYRSEPWDTYPASAASSYRGLPNLVFRSDESGAGHPGHTHCTSMIVDERTIRSTSSSGTWQWEWKFFDDYARLKMIKVSQEHPYWFLYEGTPAGRFEPDDHYFGTDTDGPRIENPDYYSGEEIYEHWQWIYIGDSQVDRVLFLKQSAPDSLPDTFGYLGNADRGVRSDDGMIVFGFGRKQGAVPLLTEMHTFYVGFRERAVRDASDHAYFSDFLDELGR